MGNFYYVRRAETTLVVNFKIAFNEWQGVHVPNLSILLFKCINVVQGLSFVNASLSLLLLLVTKLWNYHETCNFQIAKFSDTNFHICVYFSCFISYVGQL